jgi:hypothetical protein
MIFSDFVFTMLKLRRNVFRGQLFVMDEFNDLMWNFLN